MPGAWVTHVNASTLEARRRPVHGARYPPVTPRDSSFLTRSCAGGPGHAELAAKVGIETAAIGLQEPEEPRVGLTEMEVGLGQLVLIR